MNESLPHDQAIEFIRAAVAECLARDAAEVRPESRLIPDLGADSLDLIDLIFTLEKRFGVRIREQDLNMMSRPADAPGQEPGANPEFLSAQAVSQLRSWLPEVATLPDLSRVRPMQVWPLITVEALWRLVEHKMKSGPA